MTEASEIPERKAGSGVVKRRATCCCGKVRITVAGDPKVNVVCHCNNCQRRTGSAFGHSAYFDNEQIVAKTGDTSVYHVEGETVQNRHFCPSCGTTLYWSNSYFDTMTGIAGGCFSDDPLPEPAYTVNNDTRCAWVGLPKGIVDPWADK